MPGADQRALARKCIEAGADLVAGTHPHVLQGFEFYRSKLIIYSLGNFVFTNEDRPSMIVQVKIRGEGFVEPRMIPCRILNLRPTLVTDPAQRRSMLADLQARSFRVKIADDGKLTPVK
jgi:poly-gamma-glutamate synthesis protein (capsule biosynthesis protein)